MINLTTRLQFASRFAKREIADIGGSFFRSSFEGGLPRMNVWWPMSMGIGLLDVCLGLLSGAFIPFLIGVAIFLGSYLFYKWNEAVYRLRFSRYVLATVHKAAQVTQGDKTMAETNNEIYKSLGLDVFDELERVFEQEEQEDSKA